MADRLHSFDFHAIQQTPLHECRDSSGTSGVRRPVQVCAFCGETGHWKRDCRHFNASRHDENVKSNFFKRAITGEKADLPVVEDEARWTHAFYVLCMLQEHLKCLLEPLRHLNVAEQGDVRDLLSQYEDVFAKPNGELGRTQLVKHNIDTGTSLPIKQPPVDYLGLRNK
ncbi:uncharacterized protein LOC144748289 [Ciona intestinalis]